MLRLNVVFTGVNTYLFTNPLTVAFPNASRIGRSPQLGDLAPHYPTVWAYRGNKLVYLEYFHWERLEIRGFNRERRLARLRATPPVRDARRLLAIPADAVAATPEAPERVGGQVQVFSGRVDTSVGPCRRQLSWSSGSLARRSLLHQVDVGINVSGHIELKLVNLFDNDKTRDLPELPEDVNTIFVGNVCAQDVLGWLSNNRRNKRDGDFEWLEVLTRLEGRLPQIEEGRCGISDGDDVDDELREKVQTRLDGDGGGGGCGCECVGCQVRLN